MTALVLLLVAQFPLDVFEVATPFEQLESRDGVTVSQREVKGSPFKEYRVELTAPYPPELLCAAIFEWGTHEGDGPGVVLHKVLQDGDDVRVVYQQVSQPVVARRDFALTVKREHLPEGKCRIRFRTTNDAAPPRPDGFVRIERVWGQWLAEPAAAGGSKLTHTLFSDPAGSVPPFLVHGSLRSSARDSALVAVQKTRLLAQKGAR